MYIDVTIALLAYDLGSVYIPLLPQLLACEELSVDCNFLLHIYVYTYTSQLVQCMCIFKG